MGIGVDSVLGLGIGSGMVLISVLIGECIPSNNSCDNVRCCVEVWGLVGSSGRLPLLSWLRTLGGMQLGAQ